MKMFKWLKKAISGFGGVDVVDYVILRKMWNCVLKIFSEHLDQRSILSLAMR